VVFFTRPPFEGGRNYRLSSLGFFGSSLFSPLLVYRGTGDFFSTLFGTAAFLFTFLYVLELPFVFLAPSFGHEYSPSFSLMTVHEMQ